MTVPIDDDRAAQGFPGAGSAQSVPPPGRGSRRDSADSGTQDDAHAEAPQADTAALSGLLATLADDPDAPPSSVTAESVLAAARAGQPAGQPADPSGTHADQHAADRSAEQPDQQPGEQTSRNGLTAVPGTGNPHPHRPTTIRRRTLLIALVAAASLAGIAAIVVPLTLGSGASTNTASDSASESILEGSGSAAAGSTAAGNAAAGGAASLDAAGQSPQRGDQSAGANAGGAAPGGAAAAESAAASGPADVSAPAAQPSDGQADAAGPSAAAAAGAPCWPPLSPAAAAALTAALPPGAFAAPLPLDGGCEQDPVAGAVLSGSVPGTELVVRVVKAEPGACARSTGEAASRCVAAGNDRYTATDPSGGLTVFVYGDGVEVSAGSLTSVDGVPSVPTGLSADQLNAAAVAVRSALR